MDTLLMPVPKRAQSADDAQWAALGHRMAIARDRLRWSQRELARQSGVSYAHIAGVERGQKKASAEVLRRIARALNVSYSEWATLVGYADAPSALDATQDEMRRDFEDLARRFSEIMSKWGLHFGDGPTHGSQSG